MSKRSPRPTRVGQMDGVQVEISEIQNTGLREHITLINRGVMPQPMNGWALATLRGGELYFFSHDLILLPKMAVSVHSGLYAKAALSSTPREQHLVWTEEQMWNNRRDVAALFDANGVEIDCYAYPHDRVLGSAAQRRKRLLCDGGTWRIVAEPILRRA